MSDKNKHSQQNEIVFVPGKGEAHARVYFPDEASARDFLMSAVSDERKKYIEETDFTHGKVELAIGTDITYDAWVGRMRRHDDRDIRQFAVDVRDMYARDSERMDTFRDFVMSHAGVAEPPQQLM